MFNGRLWKPVTVLSSVNVIRRIVRPNSNRMAILSPYPKQRILFSQPFSVISCRFKACIIYLTREGYNYEQTFIYYYLINSPTLYFTRTYRYVHNVYIYFVLAYYLGLGPSQFCNPNAGLNLAFANVYVPPQRLYVLLIIYFSVLFQTV